MRGILRMMDMISDTYIYIKIYINVYTFTNTYPSMRVPAMDTQVLQ